MHFGGGLRLAPFLGGTMGYYNTTGLWMDGNDLIERKS